MLVRLEMDEERMSFLSFDSVPAWAVLLSLAAHMATGIALGLLYFRCIWWNVRRFTGGGGVLSMIVIAIGRFVLLGGLLALASREGALPLLMLALGVLIARSIVTRHVRKAVL